MVRLTDVLDMTIVVDWGVKPQIKLKNLGPGKVSKTTDIKVR